MDIKKRGKVTIFEPKIVVSNQTYEQKRPGGTFLNLVIFRQRT